MNKIKVLIVDDSLLVRRILRQLIENEPDMVVIGEAIDPIEARGLLQLNPDVMTLDVEMPRMDGITFLEKLMKLRPMPVVMISSLTETGADITLKALELGAFDFVPKPKLAIGDTKLKNGFDIITKIRAAYSAKDYYKRKNAQSMASLPIISIISGMGGTGALRNIIEGVTKNSPPITVWHAFPDGFIKAFAQRLTEQLSVPVIEALPNMRLSNGHIYLLPIGIQSHLTWQENSYIIKCTPAQEPGKPSIDTWLTSIAETARSHASVILITSYGSDGARGAEQIYNAEGNIYVQNPETCVVPDLVNATIERIPDLLPLSLDALTVKLSEL